MTELYLGLEIWAAVGIFITVIILATPPWMDTLPEWMQIAIAAIGGPVLWLFISFFVFWMLRDEGSVLKYSGHRPAADPTENEFYDGHDSLQYGSASDGS